MAPHQAATAGGHISQPFGSRSTRFAASTHSPRQKPPAPLAVGSRAIVKAIETAPVILTQRDGQTPLGTIAAGVEVIIDAWLPPRDGGTRYLVANPAGGYHGWLTPEHLTAVAPVVQAKRVVVPVEPPPVKTKARLRKPRGLAPAAGRPGPKA